jgi:hypothetical protein
MEFQDKFTQIAQLIHDLFEDRDDISIYLVGQIIDACSDAGIEIDIPTDDCPGPEPDLNELVHDSTINNGSSEVTLKIAEVYCAHCRRLKGVDCRCEERDRQIKERKR